MIIATPSAKSHERVTGRWIRDLKVKSPQEWAIYYVKLVVGTPIPALLYAYATLAFITRAGLEIASWACAILTIIYIAADRINRPASGQREFKFFRIGCDLFLLGLVLVGLSTAFSTEAGSDILTSLGGLRWILLLYAMTYCWELFPGLNRVFTVMVGAASVAAIYGIWQHFTGLDLIRGQELPAAPVPGTVLFAPVSFFNTPEHFGTLIGIALAFPIAAYLLDERRGSRLPRYGAMVLSLLLSLSILWTYRPGMWLAAITGVVINILMASRHALKLLLMSGAFVAAVLLVSYGSPEDLLNAVDQTEAVRADKQREQINTQVQLWEKSPWIGTGRSTLAAADYDPGTGNVYFQVLAQVGLLGISYYLLIILGFLLATYRIFHEIPKSHYWHRVFIAGSLASQITFHVAGLYWATLSEAMVFNLYVLIVAATSYLIQHYSRGIVTDDHAL